MSGESLKPSNPLNEFTFNDDTNVLIQKLVYKGEKRFKTFLQMPIFNKQSKNNCQKLIKKPSHKTT